MGKDVRCFRDTTAKSGALSSLTLGINLLRRFTPSPLPIRSTILDPPENSACRACWLRGKHALRTLNQISSFAVQRGTERGIQGGTPWFPFFRHFFVEQQRNGIPANTERARLAALGEAVGEVV